ncbi:MULTISPECIES: hypothetical protein [unclassified Variovorax]|nr:MULTISPECIES: hypothetical protein [unclassified Variovorax]PNG49986.1 hypothetical protein CHC06_05567 [Variovorax sp. B2]PNG50858.1 hypothetical protein CHC07_05472 [Variovorax sp. B4]VTV18096.1 hypothetical protein WDL1P1_00912 [Variovorax sp. WDL1]VTU41672.1 hypothetical protein H6P1_00023 [Variovorax sp. PBL-H6]VTU44626.1 hypothetical protein SRS16P1_00880 [Variovorax sp. SRS16]
MTPVKFPPVYLLEILSSPGGGTDECDNFGKLELAVQRAVDALSEASGPIEVDVSLDVSDEIEGISFLNEEQEVLALISVYHLDRDTGEATDPAIAMACRGDKNALQSAMNRIVRA